MYVGTYWISLNSVILDKHQHTHTQMARVFARPTYEGQVAYRLAATGSYTDAPPWKEKCAILAGKKFNRLTASLCLGPEIPLLFDEPASGEGLPCLVNARFTATYDKEG